MLEIVFPLLAGSAFILLGRWMYGNPKKIYPNWLYNNPDHPFLFGLVRAFATLMMFIGSGAVVSAITSRVLPGALVLMAMLAGGIAGAWFLRPRLQENGQSSASASIGSGFLSNKGKWVLGISVAVAVVSFFGIFAMIGNSEVCQLAVSRVQSNRAVVEQLGQPIKRGLMVSGSIETTGPSGHADIAIPLSGPKGNGTLYAVGVKSAGIWKLETLQLAVSGHANRVDLLDSREK
jgi:Cytochrome oxidase complex assembly protein 1